MSNPKIILFNAPPRAGKDLASEICASAFGASRLAFKDKLFEIALMVSEMDEDLWWDIYGNEAEGKPNKESPLEQLGGLSQRQFLIKISEEWVKPVFGKKYFGEAAKQSVENLLMWAEKPLITFSDSGFIEEARVLLDAYGRENVALVRIYRLGCSYKGDSRAYLVGDEFEFVADIHNKSTVQQFQKDVIAVAGEFFGELA